MTQGKERSELKGGAGVIEVNKTERRIKQRRQSRLRERQAVMPYFELWQSAKSVREGEERDGKRRAGEGTNESRGLRDNLWEGESEVVICSDHRACCALLIRLQLPWSAHTLSVYRHKTPPELEAAARFSTQHASPCSPESRRVTERLERRRQEADKNISRPRVRRRLDTRQYSRHTGTFMSRNAI